MDRLSLRAPRPEDLRLALVEVRRLHVAAPALVALLLVSLLSNLLTGIVSVVICTYLNQLFLRMRDDQPEAVPKSEGSKGSYRG